MRFSLKKVGQIGIRPGLDEREMERIRLLNIIIPLTIVLYVYYFIHGCLINEWLTSTIAVVLLLKTIFSMILIHRGKYNIAKTIMFGTTSFIVWFTYQIYPGNVSVLNFYFPSLFCIVFLFSWKKERAYLIVSLALFSLFVILSVVLPKHLFYKVELEAHFAEITNSVHFLSSLFVAITISIFGIRNKEATYRRLQNETKKVSDALAELKTAQAKLVQNEKMVSLGQLVSGINHEINNPLNFIKSGLHILNTELKNEKNSNSQVALKAINEGFEKINTVVSSLNNFIEDPKDHFSFLEIHEVLESCTNVLSMGAQKDFRLEKKYSTDSLSVIGNPGRLHQLFLNILSNAKQALRSLGIIKIETGVEEDTIVISITDNGKGIPKDQMGKIFNPYFTTKDPNEGTGLGLSISYQIVKDHKGTIDVRSEAGIGTCVVVKLPLINKPNLLNEMGQKASF